MDRDLETRRFAWALLLVWSPWVPILIGLGSLVYSLSNSKAAGIGVVAGGVTEMLVPWGAASLVVAQVVAIVWLFRSLQRTHVFRSLIAAVSICMSGLTLLLLGVFVWFDVIRRFR